MSASGTKQPLTFIEFSVNLNTGSYTAAKAFHASSAIAAVCPARQNKAYPFHLSRSDDPALPSAFHFRHAALFVKQIELGNATAEEVPEHNASFLVAVALLPDFVEALYRGVDNVAGVLSGCEKRH